jgi:predicted alpha/beta hydrolase family esterase
LADQWGGKLIDAGEKGHINLKSNLGAWEEGFRLFQAFYGELAVKV